MWTKVHQFRENWNYRQNFTFHNFFVFELWPTIFGSLVFLFQTFTPMAKYVDQNLPNSKKSRLKLKIWLPNNIFVSKLWYTKFWWLVVFFEVFPKTSKYVDQSSPILKNRNHFQNLTPKNFFFVFELWPTIFGCLVVLHEGFSKLPKNVDQSSPVSRKSWPNFKLWSPISASPKGIGRQFCHCTIGGLSPCLSFKIGGPSSIPNFCGFFFRFLVFSTLTPKISKSK